MGSRSSYDLCGLIFVHLVFFFDTKYITESGPGGIHARGWLGCRFVTINRWPARMSPGVPPSPNTIRIGSHRVICAVRVGSLRDHCASRTTTTRKSRTLRSGQTCCRGTKLRTARTVKCSSSSPEAPSRCRRSAALVLARPVPACVCATTPRRWH